jgi:hypothetical protein
MCYLYLAIFFLYVILLMQVQYRCQILVSSRMQSAIRMSMGENKTEDTHLTKWSPISDIVAPANNQIDDVLC